MDRTLLKKLPALALATSIVCSAFNAAARDQVPEMALRMPSPNGAYFVFPVTQESKSMGDRLAAYDQFCENYPSECIAVDRAPQLIPMTFNSWRILQNVFTRVRDKMRIVEDFKKYTLPGTKDSNGFEKSPDVWTRGEDDEGDCEDYVFRWKNEMEKAGFPSSALLATFVQSNITETIIADGKNLTFNQGHMVLTIRTDYGDFVADILKQEMYPLSELNKKWSIELVQSPQDMTRFFKAEIVNPKTPTLTIVQDRFPAPRLASSGAGG